MTSSGKGYAVLEKIFFYLKIIATSSHTQTFINTSRKKVIKIKNCPAAGSNTGLYKVTLDLHQTVHTS